MEGNIMANKLVAIGLIVIGFLVFASGYRYGSSSSVTIGCLLFAVGVVLLILKIIRRNKPDSLA